MDKNVEIETLDQEKMDKTLDQVRSWVIRYRGTSNPLEF